MSNTAERASIKVPRVLIEQAHERFPLTRDMSPGRMLRFALAKALGMSDADAMRATLDARVGTSREPRTDA